MDRGALWATVHGVAKSQIWLSTHIHTHTHTHTQTHTQESKKIPTVIIKLNGEKLEATLDRQHQNPVEVSKKYSISNPTQTYWISIFGGGARKLYLSKLPRRHLSKLMFEKRCSKKLGSTKNRTREKMEVMRRVYFRDNSYVNNREDGKLAQDRNLKSFAERWETRGHLASSGQVRCDSHELEKEHPKPGLEDADCNLAECG